MNAFFLILHKKQFISFKQTNLPMKYLNHFLLLALLMSCFACGGSTETNTDTDSTKTDSTEQTPEEATTESNTEETANETTVELSEEAKPFVKKWAMTSYTDTQGKTQDNIDNAFLELADDGTFVELFSGKEIASGTWNIEKEGEGMVLVLTHKKGEMASQLSEGKEKLNVKEFSPEKMITVDDGGKMSETFVPVKE